MNKHTVFYCLLFLVVFFESVFAANKQQTIPDVIIQNHARHRSEGGAMKQTVTQHQLAESGATSLVDALHSIGGLQLHDSSGTGSSASLGMRGFGANASSNSLLLINGIPLSNPDIAPPDLNTVPLEEVSRVEIIAGSESVLYGDQAVGGLINIITEPPDSKSMRFSCSAGSYNLHECHVRYADAYQMIRYQMNLSSKATANYREHNHYANNTLLGSASFAASGEWLFDYKFTNENMQFPGALTATQVFQNRRQTTNNTDYFKNNNQHIHARYLRPLFANWKIKTDAFYRNMGGVGVLFAGFTQSRGSFFLRPQAISEDNKHLIQLGADVRLDRYHLESPFGLTNNHQTQGGVYGLLNEKLNERLSLIAGARLAEQLTHLNTNISAETVNRASALSLGLTYEVSPPVSVYLRRAGNFRFPKAEENTPGNQPLRTQRGVSYESGITYDYQDRSLDLAIYQLSLRDEIAFNPYQTPQNPFGSNTNLAPTIRSGATLGTRQRLSSLLTADTQINYVNAHFQSGSTSGKQIPLVSDWLLRGGLLFRLTPRLHAYAEAVFTGRQFPANDNANITGGVGGYTIYHFNLRYQYEHLAAALHFNNIFNKYYYLYTVYQPSMLTEYFYPAPERNVLFTLNYSFD